ncbi:unnamed protein product [Linum trigynum]|uniref:DUF4283 domain-containing protein n=1 Tax=Linum trigynum TaxID=586398 RepID=A0AAV2GKQ9_9ROSI
MDLNNDTFLVTFGDEQDYLWALTGGPWVILDHYLIVHQWSPNFRTDSKPHLSVVSSVLFPELPVHFYHREVLFALGNLVGRTVKIEYHTKTLQRGKFARLAIELDMTKPLPTRVRLDGFWQPIVYENLPHICFKCGWIVHLVESCPKTTPVLQQAIILHPNSDAAQVPPVTDSPEPPSGYGPWMQVIRKSRKHSKKDAVNQGNQANLPSIVGTNSGRASAKSGGKGKVESQKTTAAMETKGKKDLAMGSKKGNSNSHKGKAPATERLTINGEHTENLIQEWRPVDSKEASSSKAQTKSATAHTSVQSSPSATNSQGAQLILGPNNTKIHVLSVPDLQTNLKDNTDPNSNSSSIRQCYRKKQQDQAPVPDKMIDR